MLATTTSRRLLVVGAAAIAAAWGYTGGPRAVRVHRARRGLRVRLLRPRGDRRHDERGHRAGDCGCRSSWAAPLAAWPAPCSSSTTCATSRQTRRRETDTSRAHRRSADEGGCMSRCSSAPPTCSCSSPRCGGRGWCWRWPRRRWPRARSRRSCRGARWRGADLRCSVRRAGCTSPSARWRAAGLSDQCMTPIRLWSMV